MKNKRFGLFPAIILVLVIVLSSLFAACSSSSPTTSASKPITLVFTSHNSGSGFWRNSVIAPYFREIEKRTNGRVIIEEHWNGELVNLKDAYDAMLKGTVDMAEFFPSMLQGRFPMDDVVGLSTYYTNRPAWGMYELAKAYPKMNEPYNDGHLLLEKFGL
jgi:TRAP-type C4-dicarboxylate transport system substrate-binding protein